MKDLNFLKGFRPCGVRVTVKEVIDPKWLEVGGAEDEEEESENDDEESPNPPPPSITGDEPHGTRRTHRYPTRLQIRLAENMENAAAMQRSRPIPPSPRRCTTGASYSNTRATVAPQR